ncbi:hypothetical protein BH20VER1_BH20VER1_17260 [soil metagenome]
MGNCSAARCLVRAGGVLLLANGVMGLVNPRWHRLLWQFSPQLTHAMSEELAVHPKTARTIYAAQAVLGLALLRGGCCE